MLSFWSLLALAVAFWRISRVFGAGIFGPRNSSHFLFCWSADSDLSIQSDCIVKHPGVTQVRKHRSSELSERSDWLRRPFHRISVVHDFGTIEPIHVVCVGQCRPHHFISDEILDIPGFKVSTVLDVRDLDTAVRGVPALVLAHDSLRPVELESTCRFVRQRWPITRILVVHDGEEFLDDSLYDDRVGSDVSGRDLISRLLFLVQTLDLWRPRDGRR